MSDKQDLFSQYQLKIKSDQYYYKTDWNYDKKSWEKEIQKINKSPLSPPPTPEPYVPPSQDTALEDLGAKEIFKDLFMQPIEEGLSLPRVFHKCNPAFFDFNEHGDPRQVRPKDVGIVRPMGYSPDGYRFHTFVCSKCNISIPDDVMKKMYVLAGLKKMKDKI